MERALEVQTFLNFQNQELNQVRELQNCLKEWRKVMAISDQIEFLDAVLGVQVRRRKQYQDQTETAQTMKKEKTKMVKSRVAKVKIQE